jgi:hypothetical protein
MLGPKQVFGPNRALKPAWIRCELEAKSYRSEKSSSLLMLDSALRPGKHLTLGAPGPGGSFARLDFPADVSNFHGPWYQVVNNKSHLAQQRLSLSLSLRLALPTFLPSVL